MLTGETQILAVYTHSDSSKGLRKISHFGHDLDLNTSDPAYAGLADSWHGESLHTTWPLGRDAPTRANPAGSTQDARKLRFTEDRKYVGRWLLSEHREHHPPLGVTNSAGAKDSSQEPTVDARIVIKLPITRNELDLACYGHAGFSR